MKHSSLIKTGFALFFLGYKISISKWIMEKMVNRRLKHNKPLSDKRLLWVNKKIDAYNGKWNKYTKAFDAYATSYKENSNE